MEVEVEEEADRITTRKDIPEILILIINILDANDMRRN